MASTVKIDFQALGQALGPASGGDLVVFVGDDLKPGEGAARLGPGIAELIAKAAPAERFKGKPQTALSVATPAGLPADRLIAVGIGGEADRGKLDWAVLGGFLAGKLSGRSATILAELPGLQPTAENIAQMALGARLRLYKFDRYKTKKKDTDENGGGPRHTFAVAEAAAACHVAESAPCPPRRAAGARDPRDLTPPMPH